MSYAQTKVFLRFFIYCFLGWLWESSYVSVKNRKLTNRGFLRGPWIPVYGFGAMIILMATKNIRDNFILVFIFGSMAATVLEYVTGVIMEKIFKVRYWDYSSQPLNIDGHICLMCTVVWGIFSVLIVNFIDPFVNMIITFVPYEYAGFIATGLIVLFVIDIVFSVRDALYLKDIAQKIYDDGVLSERAERILNEVSVFVRNRPFFAYERSDGFDSVSFTTKTDKYPRQREVFLARLDAQKNLKLSLYTYVLENCEELLDKIAQKLSCTESDREYEKLLEYEYALVAVKDSVRRSLTAENGYSLKKYKRAAGIIIRNPSADSKEYDRGLRKLRELSEQNK